MLEHRSPMDERNPVHRAVGFQCVRGALTGFRSLSSLASVFASGRCAPSRDPPLRVDGGALAASDRCPFERRSGLSGMDRMIAVRGSGERERLSYGQERLWFLEQWAPGNGAYNVSLGLRLRGRLV